ncbi:MAG: UDP-N-acetylglucosamine 2-epimerase (non-hydrolyzing) [Synergistaceae bacterium]|jgi:UDP-N-acetylglucosamine 2-epimerase (non-hydrolysing)|nr:UDP-N-acetylglucosamine 2-epimerase (non-hydrolyzing) [Synergistaceae bacterium]
MKIDVVIGTRPEAIKMAPVILELRRRELFRVRVIATGQHTDMLSQALGYFSLSADADLGIMKSRQSLDHITSAVLSGVGELFDEAPPDAVLVHGDTTTTFASALAAFYRHIPIGHVEAGLRSADMGRPFPEEMNRVFADRMATWWFAPTALARENLRREGARDDGICVTGNTVVDALKTALARRAGGDAPEALAKGLSGRRFVLLTAHRRESWGAPLERICRALLGILEGYPDLMALVPMHKNPTVRDVMKERLEGCRRVILCDPLDYPDFVWAMDNCELIMSDSGGVQEEATSLRKPALILRDVTERPEAIEQGSCVLVGTDEGRITGEASAILSGGEALARLMERSLKNPFGDGSASAKIADALSR